MNHIQSIIADSWNINIKEEMLNNSNTVEDVIDNNDINMTPEDVEDLPVILMIANHGAVLQYNIDEKDEWMQKFVDLYKSLFDTALGSNMIEYKRQEREEAMVKDREIIESVAREARQLYTRG